MIGLTVNGARQVADRMKRAVTDVRKAQDQGIRLASIKVERDLKLEVSAQGGRDAFWGKTGASGNQLAVRSGRTRQSIVGGGRVYRVGNSVSAAVGTAEQHMKRHEDGGTFQGTSPKGYSRIPTGAAQTGAGVDRWIGKSIRDIPGASLFTSKAGKLWAATRAAGARGKLVLLYLLVKQITLRPRKIFARVRDREQGAVAKIVGAEISVACGKANA